MINNKANNRAICVTYTSFERLMERMSHMTQVLKGDLDSMGNVQEIDSINVNKADNGTYKLVFNLKVVDKDLKTI